MVLAAIQGMNSSSIGIVFGTVAAAASVGKPKLIVPPTTPVIVTDVAVFAAVALRPRGPEPSRDAVP